jgi:hypothetical protein
MAQTMAEAKPDRLKTVPEQTPQLADAQSPDICDVLRETTVDVKTLDELPFSQSFKEQLHGITLAVVRRGRMSKDQQFQAR